MVGHILVPIDESEPAWDALEYALETHDDISKLTALHVVNPLTGDYYLEEETEKPRKRSEELEAEAHEQFESSGLLDAVDFEMVVESGKPENIIVEYAEDNDVDLIVIGSRGRSGLSRVLLGSVAETVVRRAPIPVTVVR